MIKRTNIRTLDPSLVARLENILNLWMNTVLHYADTCFRIILKKQLSMNCLMCQMKPYQISRITGHEKMFIHSFDRTSKSFRNKWYCIVDSFDMPFIHCDVTRRKINYLGNAILDNCFGYAFSIIKKSYIYTALKFGMHQFKLPSLYLTQCRKGSSFIQIADSRINDTSFIHCDVTQWKISYLGNMLLDSHFGYAICLQTSLYLYCSQVWGAAVPSLLLYLIQFRKECSSVNEDNIGKHRWREKPLHSKHFT